MQKPAPPNYASALVHFAERLYGDKWQGDLSRALGVHKRTIARLALAVREGRDYATAVQLLAELRAHLISVATDMEPWARATSSKKD
jgi:hypothetical protein